MKSARGRLLLGVLAVAIVLVALLGVEAGCWNGESWGSMTRTEIVARAEEMMDSTWSPLNTIYNFGYGSTYHYFYAWETYTGEAYSQCPIQDTWTEFYNGVTTTSGGTTYYGNDCSGFVSICWKLGSRYTTSTFEYDATHAGGYVDSLGTVGTCASAGLQVGDACNSANNHILLFLETSSGGRMRSMEQTPWTACRRYWYWSSLSDYRPIRRRELTGGIEKPVIVARAATGITSTQATLNAEITDTGGGIIDERRFSWGITSFCSDGCATDNPGWVSCELGVSSAGDAFEYLLTGLSPNQTYYFKGWAKNSAGWGESSSPPESFTTSSGETLTVSLSANPSSGPAPLTNICLTATVSGTATGTINYTFYCDRSDSGIDISPGYAFKIDNTTINPCTAFNVCDYLEPGTYTAKIIAERGSLQAEDRVSITVTSPPDTTPPEPDPMTWSTLPHATDSSVAMTATTASDPSGVEYYFDETTGYAGGTDSGWQDSPSYTDSGLNPGTQYCYRVKARDKSSNHNETGWSSTECAATSDTTPPEPDPMTWSTLPHATDSSVAMTATTASDPSGVEYYFDETTGYAGGTDSGWQDSPSYTDSGLNPGTQYCYRVKARDKSSNHNETGWSSTECAATSDTTPPEPDPMTWSTLPHATDSSVAMTATTASDPSGVEYYFDETTGYAGGTDSGWQDSPSYTDSGLNPGTQYCYRVKARDKSSNHNETGWSSTECAATSDTTPPEPDPMTWSTLPHATDSSVAMTATTASDPSGVEYYFDETTGYAGGTDSGWQDSPSYTDSGLNPGTQYCYRVKARDKSSNHNETGWSSTECAATSDTTPPEPDPMTWSTLPHATDSSVAMTATTASDPSGVEYYFDETTGYAGGTDSGWQDSPSYTDSGLNPGTQYCYRVKARDKSSNHNETGWSSTECAYVGTAAIFRVTSTGNVLADGAFYGSSFQSGSADVAEWVSVSEPVEPGDVLELDPNHPGYYRKSRTACSTLLAGVVSTDPGFVLGSEVQGSATGVNSVTDDSGLQTPDSALLALIGIVPVKVTNEGGSIQPGDLLVSSSTSGYAMRWDPQSGEAYGLIGKALEPFDSGTGVIQVLLMR